MTSKVLLEEKKTREQVEEERMYEGMVQTQTKSEKDLKEEADEE
jgi:hypothetical protein